MTYASCLLCVAGAQLGEFKLHQLKAAGSNGCLGDYFIYNSECLHAEARRYQHPTEYPFFGPLPAPMLSSTSGARTDGFTSDTPARATKRARTSTGGDADPILAPVPPEALVNKRLLETYRSKIIQKICEEGDCGNHGSTELQDLQCLQTISTRIYYGLFVAESKFRTDTDTATKLIKARDRDGLMAFITKPEVEVRNINRVILKAKAFSQDIASADASQLHGQSSDATSYKIDAEFVGTVFRDYIMPLTKDVEVDYLLARLD
jgi:chorismate mutase